MLPTCRVLHRGPSGENRVSAAEQDCFTRDRREADTSNILPFKLYYIPLALLYEAVELLSLTETVT